MVFHPKGALSQLGFDLLFGKMSDTCQYLFHLIPFVSKLTFIRQVAELAAAAFSVKRTGRNDSVWRLMNQFNEFSERKAGAYLNNTHHRDLSGQGTRNHDGKAFVPADALSFIAKIGEGHLDFIILANRNVNDSRFHALFSSGLYR